MPEALNLVRYQAGAGQRVPASRSTQVATAATSLRLLAGTLAVLSGVAAPTPLLAQRSEPPLPTVSDSSPSAGARWQSIPRAAVVSAAPHVVRWYEALAVAATVPAAFLVDEPLERYVQRHRSTTSDDIASVFRHVGQPEVYATVSLGTLAAGLILRKPEVTRAGGRFIATLVLSAVALESIKRISGRARPDSGLGAFHFDPFSESESFPSGHVVVAFALTTSLADDLHNTWATIGLYTVATGTAFSRINDNRHWLSDCVLGAALGITTAKLVDGHWRIFNIRPPHFLIGPSGAGVTIGMSF